MNCLIFAARLHRDPVKATARNATPKLELDLVLPGKVGGDDLRLPAVAYGTQALGALSGLRAGDWLLGSGKIVANREGGVTVLITAGSRLEISNGHS